MRVTHPGNYSLNTILAVALAGAGCGSEGGEADAGARGDAGALADGGHCTPACAARQCGDDGCGGSCGACEDESSCTPEGLCDGSRPLCPPMGAVGVQPGNVLPDLALEDCEGNVHRLHDLCAARASYLFVYAGW